MNLSRNWSFSPSITPSLQWQDKYDPFTPVTSSSVTVIPLGIFRGAQGRVNTANTLRYRASSSLTLDQNYSLTARMEPNGTSLDRSLDDGGIETHHLSWVLFYRPSFSTQLRSFSGYDLRALANEDPNAFRQRRIDPWSTELTLQPKRSRWDYFFRQTLGYYPTRTTAWEADARARLPHKTFWETGLIYGTRGSVTWNNRVGFFPSTGWRIDATVNSVIPNDGIGSIRNGSITQSEFVVTRDLHCWEAQFAYKDLPPFTHQFSVLFNLKLGAQAAKKIANQDLESQFYPWRARD